MIIALRRTVVICYNLDNVKSPSEKRKLRIDVAVSVLKQNDNFTSKKANMIIYRIRKYVIVKKTDNKIIWSVDKITVNRA